MELEGVTLVSQIFGAPQAVRLWDLGLRLRMVMCHKFINDGRCSEIMITLRPTMLYEFVSSSHEKIGKLKWLHY